MEDVDGGPCIDINTWIILRYRMFSGTHLVAFEVTMPRLWMPDYYPNGTARYFS